jgi:tryptophan synthase alpha chain
VGVGFGVQRPDQAAWIAGFADAVIVGSAITRLVEDGGRAGAPARVAGFVRELRSAMHAARQKRTGAS